MPNVAYHMPIPPSPLFPGSQTACEVCGFGDRVNDILLCDRCDKEFHMSCLELPLSIVPEAGHPFATVGLTARRGVVPQESA